MTDEGPSPSADRWKLVDRILSTLLVFLGAVATVPVVSGWFRGVSVPANVVVLSLALAASLVLSGILIHQRYRERKRRASETTPIVPESLLVEWRTFQGRAREVYAARSSTPSYWIVTARNVLNYLNTPKPGRAPSPEETTGRVRANTVLSSYQSGSSDVALGYAGWLLRGYARGDVNAFWAAREMIETVVVSGATLADEFVDALRQAGIAGAERHVFDAWNTFAGTANRLGDDLSDLERKTFETLGTGQVTRVPPIRNL